MSKSPQQIEKEFVDGLKYETNKNLSDWLLEIKSSKINKRSEIIKWLKCYHNFGHMNASLLTSIYLNEGKLVYGISKRKKT